MIERALSEVGAARSIVIDENGVVLAGNATIEAAAAAGIENVQIIDADGETIIAVRRSGLTDEQKKRLALYDNRAAELADWDADVLAALRDEGATDGMFFDAEIDQIVGAPDDFDPNAEWVGMPEFSQGDVNSVYKITVHFASMDAFREFEGLVGQKVPENTRSIWHPKLERENFRQFGYVSDEA